MSKLIRSFEQLATKHSSLSEDREAILGLLKPKAKKAVASLDLGKALDQFREWLLEVVRTERPPKTIRALNFGLFESEEGFTLYVSGADSYDAEDADWACANDWWPERRYAKIDLYAELSRSLRDSGEKGWEVAQAIAIILVKGFFAASGREFQKASGLKHVYVVTGFDDGNLYEVRPRLAQTNV